MDWVVKNQKLIQSKNKVEIPHKNNYFSNIAFITRRKPSSNITLGHAKFNLI